MHIVTVAIIALLTLLVLTTAEQFTADTIAEQSRKDLTSGKINAALGSVKKTTLTKVSFAKPVQASLWSQWVSGAKPYAVTARARPKYTLQGDVVVVGTAFTVTGNGNTPQAAHGNADEQLAATLKQIQGLFQRTGLASGS